MGLAAKLAASQQQQQGFAPPGYAPPSGPPPQGGYDSKSQYSQPPPQQQQYQPPPPQQHQQQNTYDPRQIESVLAQAVQDQALQAFYPPGSLGPIAHRVATSGALDVVARLYKLERESAISLASAFSPSFLSSSLLFSF